MYAYRTKRQFEIKLNFQLSVALDLVLGAADKTLPRRIGVGCLTDRLLNLYYCSSASLPLIYSLNKPPFSTPWPPPQNLRTLPLTSSVCSSRIHSLLNLPGMNNTGEYERGQTICRPSGWRDVVQFFLLNYGLHAITVLTEPGSTPLACALASFTAILMPSVGIARAVDEISRFAIWGGTDLQVALRAGALCMLVPAFPSARHPSDRRLPMQNPSKTASPDSEKSSPQTGETPISDGSYESPSPIDKDMIFSHQPLSSNPVDSHRRPKRLSNYAAALTATFLPVSTYLTQVHGEYPPDLKQPDVGATTLEAGVPEDPSHLDYSLIAVPRNFKVSRLLGHPDERTRYDIIKGWFKELVLNMMKPGEHKLSASQRDSTSTSLGKSGARDSITPQEFGDASKTAGVADTNLASNFNFVKTIAAIVQIIYGSFELYKIGKPRLSQYGYATYQLTVIPYILMSLANLVAGLTGPRYPSRYLVHYRGIEAPESEEDPDNANKTPSDEIEMNYPRGWWSKGERKKVEEQTSGVVGLVYGAFLDREHEAELIDELKRLYRENGNLKKAVNIVRWLTRSTTFIKTKKVGYLRYKIFDAEGANSATEKPTLDVFVVAAFSGFYGCTIHNFISSHQIQPRPQYCQSAVMDHVLVCPWPSGFNVVILRRWA